MFLGDAEGEEVVRVVNLDGDLVFCQRPLDLADDGVGGDDVLVLPEADGGEVPAGELDAVLLVDEVEDGAGDGDEDLLGRCRRCGGGGVAAAAGVVLREEVLDEVADVDGGVEGGFLVRVFGRH